MKQNYILLLLFATIYSFAQVTPPTNLQSYYSGVDFTATGTNLKNDLATKTINKHTNYLSYSQVWNALKITDEDPDVSANVLLLYGFNDTDGNITTDRTRSKNDNGGSVGDWNREHTYPKSLGTPNLGTSGPGSDAQMLRPSDVQRNGARGNKKFANGSGNSGNSNGGWYPGDEWKGDCARIIMYMYVRYGNQCLPTNVGFGSSTSTPDNMIDLFLQWNAEDPVSDFEIVRNDYHDSNGNYAQGNRNPFIDNPYLATIIWGGTAAENLWETTTAVNEFSLDTVTIFPNPVKKENSLFVNTQKDLSISIYNILGKTILRLKASKNNTEIDISSLNSGVYLVQLKSTTSSVTKKLIIQ